MLDSKVTIFRDILSKDPAYITLKKALERIKEGNSKVLVEKLRETKDGEIKKKLPCICFSGVFKPTRLDENLLTHSGFIILDFDKLYDTRDEAFEVITNHPSIFACWVSPSGDGLKALLRIANPEKHREHFNAIRKEFPALDKSGINVSRVCFESYDPDLWINYEAVPYTETFEEVVVKEVIGETAEIIKRLLVWLNKKGEAFVSGNRNLFVFKLASAACAFGINEHEFLSYAQYEYGSDGFTSREIKTTVASAYSKTQFGKAKFEKNVLVDVEGKEVVLGSADSKDIFRVEDVKDDLKDLFEKGHPDIHSIGVDDLDRIFKPKRGEVTLLTGYGNHGKSQKLRWYLVMRALVLKEKFAFFAPEDAPVHEFFFNCAEMLLGCNLLPNNTNRPKEELFQKALKFLHEYFVFVYPSEISPTPVYVKGKFLQVILELGVDGVIIDPFNQLANDYGSTGGRSDKYLETFLSDFAKFVRDNKVYGFIVAHPKTPKKDKDGNYPEPTPFDVADGTMWNNKIDDILVYHRPDYWTDMNSSRCTLRSAKVRRQWKAQRDIIEFEYSRIKRRFIFNGYDPMQKVIKDLGLFDNYQEIEDNIKPRELTKLSEVVTQSELFNDEIPF